jgi:hypothetical protein
VRSICKAVRLAVLLPVSGSNWKLDQAVSLTTGFRAFGGNRDNDFRSGAVRGHPASKAIRPVQLMPFSPELHKHIKQEANGRCIYPHENHQT